MGVQISPGLMLSEVIMTEYNFTKRDLIQINAFKSIIRQNLDVRCMIPEAALTDAITATSDDSFAKADKKLIKEVKTVKKLLTLGFECGII